MKRRVERSINIDANEVGARDMIHAGEPAAEQEFPVRIDVERPKGVGKWRFEYRRRETRVDRAVCENADESVAVGGVMTSHVKFVCPLNDGNWNGNYVRRIVEGRINGTVGVEALKPWTGRVAGEEQFLVGG